jgi:MoaA/NifB/PqqE/SkfB family radical SAM enzyme
MTGVHTGISADERPASEHRWRAAKTPLGLWQYDPESGLNVLDTDIRAPVWRPLIVSLALTGRCVKGCPFCYASSTPEGTSAWMYEELLEFIVDLDRHEVFSVTLGGGEPTLWQDPVTGKTFYDLIGTLHSRVSLSLTFTTSGVPRLAYDRLPDLPVRVSCQYPQEVEAVLEVAHQLRGSVAHVGINVLLWKSQLDGCLRAIERLASAGFTDLLLLTVQTVGFGGTLSHEAMNDDEVARFLERLPVETVRLTACHRPPDRFPAADMGCGANDWFVSVSERKIVQSCSFVPRGQPLLEPTYRGLLAARQSLPRLPCYRCYQRSPVAAWAARKESTCV